MYMGNNFFGYNLGLHYKNGTHVVYHHNFPRVTSLYLHGHIHYVWLYISPFLVFFFSVFHLFKNLPASQGKKSKVVFACFMDVKHEKKINKNSQQSVGRKDIK
jgi:hypothetical protein